MSTNPANLYHLDAGYLAEGGPADLIVLNRDASWVAGEYLSKAENTPFTGKTMKGCVEATVCGGKFVYRNR